MTQQVSIEQALFRAKKATKQGDFVKAVQFYTAILQSQPQHPIAKKALRKLQKNLQSDQISSLKSTAPSQIQINELIELYTSGQWLIAEEACKKLLHIYPDSLFAFNMLGAILKGKGKLQEAIKIFDKAIKLNPDHPEAYSNRGITLQDLGRLEQAVKNYDKAIRLKPDYAEAYYNRGNALKDLGQLEAAVKNYDKAIQLKPDYVEAYNNRGISFQGLEQLDLAVNSYDKAIQLKPDYAEAYCNRGNVLLKIPGRLNQAFLSIRKSISLEPENNLFWTGLGACLQEMEFTVCDDNLENILLQALEKPTIRPTYISKAIFSAIQNQPKFLKAVELFNTGTIDKLTQQLSTLPLLISMMQQSSIANLEIENLLTQMRKAILNSVMSRSEVADIQFYETLAMHCFINEYVFLETEEEKNQLEILERRIENAFENGESISQIDILVLAAYRPLSDYCWSENLLESPDLDAIQMVVVGQIKNVKQEQSLRTQILCLSPVEDEVSQAVRDQYEENPYPLWVKASLSDKPRSIKQVVQLIKLDLDVNKQKFSSHPNILIAGCGTGHHALSTASKFLNCQVLALDLSLSSLSYAKRKTQEQGVSNIQYMQGDILQLKDFTKKFDIIESVGVLHHMDDPLAGWKILVGKLKNGGLMKIGLYSDIARKSIVATRELIAQKNYTTSQDDIRRCRAEIFELNQYSNHIIGQLVKMNDFYSLSECRDLIFHVQEHRFTLPQIESALNELGLRFLGFECDQSWVMRQFNQQHPEEKAKNSLELWHQFELQNPSAFLGMYQFWVQKN